MAYRNRTPTSTSKLVRSGGHRASILVLIFKISTKRPMTSSTPVSQKMFAAKFAPDATAEARGGVKTILSGHPDILERVDAVIFQNEQALARVYEFAMSEAAAGRDVFGSCAAGQK